MGTRNIWDIVMVGILLISSVGGVFLIRGMNTATHGFREETNSSTSNFTELGSTEWENGSSTISIIAHGSMGDAIAVGDVDGDGHNDVVTTSDDTSFVLLQSNKQASLRIWDYNNGNFNLKKEKVWYGDTTGGAIATSVKIVDIGGVNYIITGGSIKYGSSPSFADIRIWRYTSGNIDLVSNATWRVYDDKNSSVSSIYVGDINSDGYVEVVAAGNIKWSVGTGSNQKNYSQAELSVWKINGDMRLSLLDDKIWTDPDNRIGTSYVDVKDINGDGTEDIVEGGWLGFNDSGVIRDKAQITIWHFASGSLQKINDVEWTDTNSCIVRAVDFYDINNDGKYEIIAAGGNKYLYIAIEISIWDYNLNQMARNQFYIDPEGQPGNAHWDCFAERVIVNDFDDDGVPDIIATGLSKGPHSGGNTFWGYLAAFHYGDGSISMDAKYYWVDHDGSQVFDMAYGDIDNDGTMEIFTMGYFWDSSNGFDMYAKIYAWHYESQVPEFSPVFIIPLIIVGILFKRKIKNL